MSEVIKFQFAVSPGAEVAKLQAKHGAQRQDGGKILILVVSRADFRRDDSVEGFNRTVTDYEILLQDTYGAENVTLRGAGYETFPGREPSTEGEREYLERLDFSEIKYLAQNEFAMLVRSMSGEKYDQIYIVGHGDPKFGLLFFGGRDLGGEISLPVGFAKERAKRAGLSKPKNWPLNPGCKILIIGCGTAAGNFADFLDDYEIATKGDIYSMYGDFYCKGVPVTLGPPEIPPEERPTIGRITYGWYHTEQHESIKDLGLWLGIQEARQR